ncbi:hypothetical protein V5O48_004079 [Marasmius crinis-equi]|uniref:Uncharacterized protein n=1 Tax=Marasmius crinis-equi TaxID=585013 RepID=A0ABR3FR29_9AGAR
MGLFKRILSLGSKKSKKKRPEIVHSAQVDEVGCPSRPQASTEEDTEVAVNLLLRSSSTRYAVVAEMDCTSLPPLPHPINNFLSTPSESTTSLESTNITRRGTYSVKVHPREQHTPRRKEAAVSQEDMTTSQALLREPDGDASQLIRLRRDPSVASLLDLYDEHGQLPAQAFSDSPEKRGRAQTKRSGSTLRQLLGHPSRTDVDATEGDISWAERYLGEGSSAASSMSSLALRTPDNFDYTFPETHNHLSHDNAQHEITLSSDNDLSSHLNPTISSMEVELSMDSQRSERIPDRVETLPYQNPDPKTPSRASQIFGFLTEKRRSHAPQDCDRSLPDPPSAFSSPSEAHLDGGKSPYMNQDSKTPMRASQIFSFLTERRRSRPPEDCERSLPDLPSVFSSPSDKDTSEGFPPSHFSSDHSVEITSSSSHIPATPIPITTLDTFGHHRTHAISYDPFESRSTPQQRPSSYVSSRAPSPLDVGPVSEKDSQDGSEPGVAQGDVSAAELTQVRKVKVIMTIPTKVIVTAPTPSNNPEHNRPPTRIPRGPRSLHKRRSSSSMKEKEYRPSLLDRSNSAASAQISDPFTPVISRPRKLQRSSSSNSMNCSDCLSGEQRKTDKHRKHRKPTPTGLREALQKENSLGLSVKNDVPSTPIRTNSSRSSLFRAVVTPSSFKPPAGMAPSPASSSELSPVGRQMMMEARNTKHRTRSKGSERDHGARKSSKRHVDVL